MVADPDQPVIPSAGIIFQRQRVDQVDRDLVVAGQDHRIPEFGGIDPYQAVTGDFTFHYRNVVNGDPVLRDAVQGQLCFPSVKRMTSGGCCFIDHDEPVIFSDLHVFQRLFHSGAEIIIGAGEFRVHGRMAVDDHRNLFFLQQSPCRRIEIIDTDQQSGKTVQRIALHHGRIRDQFGQTVMLAQFLFRDFEMPVQDPVDFGGQVLGAHDLIGNADMQDPGLTVLFQKSSAAPDPV